MLLKQETERAGMEQNEGETVGVGDGGQKSNLSKVIYSLMCVSPPYCFYSFPPLFFKHSEEIRCIEQEKSRESKFTSIIWSKKGCVQSFSLFLSF